MYPEYLAILIWTPIRKTFGVLYTMFLLILEDITKIPIRGYSRNVVYNYVLQNDIYLQRLLQRPIERNNRAYYTIKPYHGTNGGYIKYRKISWFEYKLVYYFLYQWYDDDSNEDTYDKGYNRTIINGARLAWLPSFIKKDLQRDIDKVKVFGNAFDLGDKRAEYPLYGFWSALLWSIRNTAYNSKYMTMEKHISDKNIFMIELGKWKFGWKQDKVNKNNFSFVAFGWD